MTNSTKQLLAQLDVIEQRAKNCNNTTTVAVCIQTDIPALCDAVRELAQRVEELERER